MSELTGPCRLSIFVKFKLKKQTFCYISILITFNQLLKSSFQDS
jgi:hypothetical protein